MTLSLLRWQSLHQGLPVTVRVFFFHQPYRPEKNQVHVPKVYVYADVQEASSLLVYHPIYILASHPARYLTIIVVPSNGIRNWKAKQEQWIGVEIDSHNSWDCQWKGNGSAWQTRFIARSYMSSELTHSYLKMDGSGENCQVRLR